MRPVPSQTPVKGYVGNDYVLSGSSRSCPVAGYLRLSAGTISVTGPNGSATAAPSSTAGSVAYSQVLPQGFLRAGTYSVSATGGSTVGPFEGSITVDAPIQITAIIAPANSGDPCTVEWTGGSPTSMVKVSLVYKAFLTERYDYAYASARAGSYSFQPICSGNPVPAGNGVFCSFGLPAVTEVVAEQMPTTDQMSTFQASGITGGVQVYWIYRWIFGFVEP